MREFSKTLRFDFPRIPVVGTLMLTIVAVNVRGVVEYFIKADGDLKLGVVAAIVVALGTAGITCSQLIGTLHSPIRTLSLRSRRKNKQCRSTWDWFLYLRNEARPVQRARTSSGDTSVSDRRDIRTLEAQEVKSTLHALEMECREKCPSLGVQLEYYYSMFLVFFLCSMTSAVLLVVAIADNYVDWPIKFNPGAAYADAAMLLVGMIGAKRTRAMQESLRITLFNQNRPFVLQLLGGWYQCRFVAVEQESSAERQAAVQSA